MSSALPKHVMILRHAHSSWATPGQRDHARPLDERGRREARELGERLGAEGPLPDTVICSTAARARETLEAIRPHLSEGARIEFSDHLYALGVDAYFQAIEGSGCDGTLMLIGHNPMIEDFALALVDEVDPAVSSSGMRTGIPTCGLAIVSLQDPTIAFGAGCGRLEAFHRPERVAS